MSELFQQIGYPRLCLWFSGLLGSSVFDHAKSSPPRGALSFLNKNNRQ
jgi:hypothetical protein